MAPFELVVRASRAVVSGADVQAVEVGVQGGRIAEISSLGSGLPGDRIVTAAEDEVLLPGLVDTHVHVNDPGTDWEGFDSATRAAAAGGVTTILDMPLNSIPLTVDVSALAVKRAAAQGRCQVDVGFWGGAVPGNLAELPAMLGAGVFGFKCFLAPSGMPGFDHLSPAELEPTLRVVRREGAILLVHAEDGHVLEAAPVAEGSSYQGFLRSRPAAAEVRAISMVIELARRTGARVHIAHLSSAEALPEIEGARADGVALTVETCPHYLTLAAEDIPDGATAFKCCPPIRAAANRDRLWQGLADGLIDAVVSDHSPCPAELKLLDTGDFGGAWGGISSLQLGLPLVWTEASRRGFELTDVLRWMAAGPAGLAGLQRKGRLALDFDADLVLFAPEEEWTVDAAKLWHRHPVSPYDGRKVRGSVRRTFLRGLELTGEEAAGQLLSRGET